MVDRTNRHHPSSSLSFITIIAVVIGIIAIILRVVIIVTPQQQ